MDPQLVIVGLCLAAAAIWLGWRIVRLFRTPAAGCGTGCHACSHREEAEAKDGFVSVDQLVQSSRKG
jgi:hypothetical protein